MIKIGTKEFRSYNEALSSLAEIKEPEIWALQNWDHEKKFSKLWTRSDEIQKIKDWFKKSGVTLNPKKLQDLLKQEGIVAFEMWQYTWPNGDCDFCGQKPTRAVALNRNEQINICDDHSNII